ncbi:MAG: PAS domain S-box protein [Acidobacteria bacterium]|nr:PAS domain S-box protein [Acidobacteriota bacterium]MCL5288845.1 PAS domain S-box protein [Acidobacteriota bacterium]
MKLETKIGVGFGVAILTLVGVGIASYLSLSSLLEAAEWRRHAGVVLRQIDSLALQLARAESSRRGYVITGDPSFRKNCEDHVQGITPALRELRELTADNTSQQQRLDKLEPLLRERLALLTESLALPTQLGKASPRQVELTERGAQLAEQTRNVFAEMRSEENRLLMERNAIVQARTQLAIVVILSGSALGILLVAFAAVLSRRDFAARRAAELALQRAHDELEERVVERTAELLQANEALRESEAKFRSLAECTTAGIFIFQDDRFIYVNPGAEVITGYTTEELLGMEFWQLVHPDFRAVMQQRALARSRGEKVPPRFEVKILIKGGEERWVDYTVRQIEYQGVLTGLGTANDITERKQAETLAAAERRILELTASNAPLPEILDLVARSIEAQTSGMRCSILLLDEDGIHIRHGAAPSLPEAYVRAIDGLPIGPNVGSCGTAAYRKQQVIVTDIATDPLWADYRAVALLHSLRACWSTPILAAAGQVLGTFAMYYDTPRSPQPSDLKLIERATHLICIAIERERTRQEVTDALAFIQTIFESSPVGFLTLTPAGQCLTLNQAMAGIVGGSIEVMKSLNFFELDWWKKFGLRATAETALRTQTEQRLETRVVTAFGKELWLSAQFVPFHHSGKLLLLGLFSDVTERKRAEEERSRLFNLSLDMMCVAGFDGRLKQVNPAWSATLGWTAEELTAKPWLDFVHPDDLEATRAAGAQLLGGQSVRTFENRYRCKDGSYRWLSWNSFPLVQSQEMFAVTRDVTERKQAEEAVRASAQRLRDLIDGLGPSLLVGLLTPDGVLVEVNRPALEAAGLRPEDVLGQPVVDTYWLAYSETVQQQYRAAVARAAAGEPVRYDVQIRVAEGTLIWIDLTLEPLRDASGNVAFLVASAAVIDERKRAEAALQGYANRLEIISAANLALTQTLDLESVLDTLLDYLQRLVPYDSANVMLLEAESRMAVRALRGYQTWAERELTRQIEFDPGSVPLIHSILTRQQSRLVPDTEKFPEWVRLRGAEHVRSWIGVPLIAGGKVIGIYSVDKAEPEFFTEEHVQLAETLAAQAAVAVQNALLYDARTHVEWRLRQLSNRLLRLQEDERRRLARDLHDSFAQTIAAVSLNLARVGECAALLDEGAGKALAEARENVKQTAEDVRTLTYLLHPPLLEELGLAAALRAFAKGFSARSGIQTTVQTAENFKRLPDEVEAALFRVVQESLANVQRHSGSATAEIQLRRTERNVHLEIRDRGKGVPQNILDSMDGSAEGLGVGILGMRERLRQFGGRLEIISSGHGTTVQVILPLEE